MTVRSTGAAAASLPSHRQRKAGVKAARTRLVTPFMSISDGIFTDLTSYQPGGRFYWGGRDCQSPGRCKATILHLGVWATGIVVRVEQAAGRNASCRGHR